MDNIGRASHQHREADDSAQVAETSRSRGNRSRRMRRTHAWSVLSTHHIIRSGREQPGTLLKVRALAFW